MSEPRETARGPGRRHPGGPDEVLAALATSPGGGPREPGPPSTGPPAPATGPPPPSAFRDAGFTVRPDASPAQAGMPRRRTALRARSAATPDGGRVPDRKQRRAAKPPPPGLSPAVGLPVLVLCGLLALFVAWVSAEPFWLAVGHHDRGVVEVTRCTGSGEIGTRCVGTFEPRAGEYAVDLAAVSGAPVAERKVGTALPARMVSEQGRIAYVGDTGGLHLRWLVGLGVLLVLGLVMSVATGAWRFRGSARAGAVLVSVLAPLAIVPVTLALSY